MNKNLLLLVLLLGGCASGTRVVVVYRSYDIMGYTELELKADSTFLFSWATCLDDGVTPGKWKRNGKYIVLNDELVKEKLKVEESTQGDTNRVYIEIYDSVEREGLFSAIVYVDTLRGLTDEHGKLALEPV